MTLYEPKWSAPGDGTNTEPGEYEAWLEFKALVEAGHLVPVEPDREAGARAHAKNLGDVTMRDGTPFPDIYSEVDVILIAALGIGETP